MSQPPTQRFHNANPVCIGNTFKIPYILILNEIVWRIIYITDKIEIPSLFMDMNSFIVISPRHQISYIIVSFLAGYDCFYVNCHNSHPKTYQQLVYSIVTLLIYMQVFNL